MENAAQKVKDWWEVADRTQRFVTIFGASALVLLLVLTAYVMSRPKMSPLYSGLTPEDQGKIVSELRKNGISVELGERGSVMVPTGDAPEAEAIVARASLTPSDGPQGFDLLFGSQSFAETSQEEKERIIAAKEGELAKTIMTWQGVASAKVHWNVGDDSPFASEATPGSATVNIVESGAGLSGAAGKAVARLVQNATGVPPENITVVNSLGRMLYDGQLLNDVGFGAGQKLAAEIQEARRREADLARSLDLAFGPGNTIAMVQVELDMDAVNIQETIQTPSDAPSTKQSVTESLQGGAATRAGGPPGYINNNPGRQPTEISGDTQNPGSYSQQQNSEYHPTDVKSTTTTKAPGGVEAMTVQILANKKNIKDLKAVEQFANAYLGSNFNQPGFKATVTGVEFDTKAAEEAKKAASAVATSQKLQQLVSILPVLALVVVGFLVIKAITKAAANRVPTMSALPAGAPMAVPVQHGLPVMGAPAQKPAVPSYIQYEGMTDMPTPQSDAGQKLATALGSGSIEDALRIIEQAPEDPEIKAIQARINVPLEQIKHMAKTKPQSVAMLLKGWMMEDMR